MKKIIRILTLSVSISIIAVSNSLAADAPAQCPVKRQDLSESEMDMARHAWKYFENNYQKATGLVNAVDGYPSTTLWDSGSSMAAFISAERMGIIPPEKFHEMVKTTLDTLATLDLFNGIAPNKVYNTQTAAKVDYGNTASEVGIGISILDLGRIASWLNILACLHPQYKPDVEKVLESWSYCELFDKGQMFGMGKPDDKGMSKLLQEGRLGYEQYAAKVFKNLGFNLDHSANYWNKFTETVKIYDVPIAVDKRDSAKLGAYNYVVTESYVMDIIENGTNDVIEPLARNILKVQEQRWKKTGQVTAVSEDNLDQAPYFVYNTIYTDGVPWKALTDTGKDMAPLKTVSIKAALSMAYVFPEEDYSKVLMDTIKDARNPKGGWYSGVYEKDGKFNTATTANTNGVILSTLLYKMYGSLNKLCKDCNKGAVMKTATVNGPQNKAVCRAELPDRIANAKKIAKVAGERRKAKIFLAGLDKIWSSMGNFNQAKALMETGKTSEAVALIDKTKGQIWGLGDSFVEEQESFRKLMGPADVLMGRWNRGDASASPEEINQSLLASANNICKRQVEKDPALKAISTSEGFCKPPALMLTPVASTPAASEQPKSQVMEKLEKIAEAIAILEKANQLQTAQKTQDALSSIEKCKEKVWGFGDKYAEHKAAFHELMGPMDYLMSEWKKGNKEINTAFVQGKLRDSARTICQQDEQAKASSLCKS